MGSIHEARSVNLISISSTEETIKVRNLILLGILAASVMERSVKTTSVVSEKEIEKDFRLQIQCTENVFLCR